MIGLLIHTNDNKGMNRYGVVVKTHVSAVKC